MDPRNGGDLLCSQEGVYSVPCRGRREGGAGYGCCPIEVGGGDPQDPPRVPAGRDDEEEQGGARALLPEDLPPVVGTPGSGEGGGQVPVSPTAGRVRRRREGGAPSGLPGERLAYDGVRGVGLVPSYTGLVGRGRADASSAPSTNTVICERRIQLGHCPRVRGPRLVQVRGRVPGVARLEGVQQGWGAAAEGHGRPCSREPQGVPHAQGPARPVGLAPLHPVPVEGRLRADEPRLDGVHDLVHRREQRRGPRSVQGADGREGGLVEESPRTARQVTPCGSVRLVRLRHRVRHQAPDRRLLRFAAGPGVYRPIPPSAWHGTAGSAKGSGGGDQGANTCDRCTTDVGSRRCTWILKKAAPAGPARSCEGVCAP